MRRAPAAGPAAHPPPRSRPSRRTAGVVRLLVRRLRRAKAKAATASATARTARGTIRFAEVPEPEEPPPGSAAPGVTAGAVTGSPHEHRGVSVGGADRGSRPVVLPEGRLDRRVRHVPELGVGEARPLVDGVRVPPVVRGHGQQHVLLAQAVAVRGLVGPGPGVTAGEVTDVHHEQLHALGIEQMIESGLGLWLAVAERSHPVGDLSLAGERDGVRGAGVRGARQDHPERRRQDGDEDPAGYRKPGRPGAARRRRHIWEAMSAPWPPRPGGSRPQMSRPGGRGPPGSRVRGGPPAAQMLKRSAASSGRTRERKPPVRNGRWSRPGRRAWASAAVIMPWSSASMKSLTRPVPTSTESRKP